MKLKHLTPIAMSCLLLNACTAEAGNPAQNVGAPQTENLEETTAASPETLVTEPATPAVDFKIVPEGMTIETRFVCTDADWERPYTDDYSKWLLNLKLFPDEHETTDYEGITKPKSSKIYVGVVDMDLIGAFGKNGKERPADLQQCADACMRLWAEYLWNNKMYEKIHFKNSGGSDFSYAKWAEGYRMHLANNRVTWSKDAAPDYSYTNFRKYMSTVFMYCGTLSMSRELKSVRWQDIKPGDMLIFGGSPGHVVTIMDVMRNKKTGELRAMLSQSYMPAQETEILAYWNNNYSPWYDINIDTYSTVETPQWYFELEHGSKFVRWADR